MIFSRRWQPFSNPNSVYLSVAAPYPRGSLRAPTISRFGPMMVGTTSSSLMWPWTMTALALEAAALEHPVGLDGQLRALVQGDHALVELARSRRRNSRRTPWRYQASPCRRTAWLGPSAGRRQEGGAASFPVLRKSCRAGLREGWNRRRPSITSTQSATAWTSWPPGASMPKSLAPVRVAPSSWQFSSRGFPEVRLAQVGPAKFHLVEVGPEEAGLGRDGPGTLSSFTWSRRGLPEVCLLEVRLEDLGTFEVGLLASFPPPRAGLVEVGVGQRRFLEVHLAHARQFELGVIEACP